MNLGGAGIQFGLYALLNAMKMKGSMMQNTVPMQQHFIISKYPNTIKKNMTHLNPSFTFEVLN